CIAARRLYTVFRDNIEAALAGSEHARYLARIGFGDDVAAAAQVDRVSVVPVLHGGHIVRRAE
ncbi:MAG: 2-phosphosulfolactate phosphatase, partial [Bacillota bacterium]|nr:2-phosphosulfolactate phosphatase [Bacillota bacterium]